MKLIKRKNVVIADAYSGLIHVMSTVRNTVENLNAEWPAKPPVRIDGLANQ